MKIDIKSLAYLASIAILIYWRLGWNRKITAIVDKAITEALATKFAAYERNLARNTEDISSLRRQAHVNKTATIMLTWESAGMMQFFKKAPTTGETEQVLKRHRNIVSTFDYRDQLGSDDLDSIP